MKIVVHGPNCKRQTCSTKELHVVGTDVTELAKQIYALMVVHDIPFYQVEPHNQACPGLRFPWEDLELKLFEYSH